MKLSAKGRYAIKALVNIATNESSTPKTLLEISKYQGISLSYLEQLFSKLKSEKLVKSARGSYGGYMLEKNPKDIKISYIISAVDEEVKTLKCKRDSKKGCNGKNTKCITHNLWDDLEKHINSFFDKVNLDDLVEKKF